MLKFRIYDNSCLVFDGCKQLANQSRVISERERERERILEQTIIERKELMILFDLGFTYKAIVGDFRTI